jgi:hypothetical protein
VYYASYNLKEFVATALGNNTAFREMANNMTYLRSDMSLLEKVAEFIQKMISRVATQFEIKPDTIAMAAIQDSLALIEATGGGKTSKPITKITGDSMIAIMEELKNYDLTENDVSLKNKFEEEFKVPEEIKCK